MGITAHACSAGLRLMLCATPGGAALASAPACTRLWRMRCAHVHAYHACLTHARRRLVGQGAGEYDGTVVYFNDAVTESFIRVKSDELAGGQYSLIIQGAGGVTTKMLLYLRVRSGRCLCMSVGSMRPAGRHAGASSSSRRQPCSSNSTQERAMLLWCLFGTTAGANAARQGHAQRARQAGDAVAHARVLPTLSVAIRLAAGLLHAVSDPCIGPEPPLMQCCWTSAAHKCMFSSADPPPSPGPTAACQRH